MTGGGTKNTTCVAGGAIETLVLAYTIPTKPISLGYTYIYRRESPLICVCIFHYLGRLFYYMAQSHPMDQTQWTLH